MNIINILADKNDIGLGNVDNTSDLNKPVSTAQQTALNTKENLSNKSTDTALGTSDTLYPTQKATKTYVDNKFNTVAVSDATSTTKGIIKLAGDFGGTADLPTVPGLATKENIITAGTTAQYYRGDKTFQTLNKSAVGLSNVDNTSDVNKPISTATQTALNSKQNTLGFTPENVSNKENLTLDNSTSKYPTNNLVKNTLNNYLLSSLKGTANGLAELDATGKILSAQLPSYVDDVLEYASISLFPVTGESGKIYIATNTNISYRWSGSVYVEISSSVALGETSSTAYRGDRGKIAYDHSQTIGNPHNTTKNDIGLGNVDNTSDLNKPISTATQTALNGKQNSLGYTAENVANKDTDILLAANSDTKYASQKAVKTYIDNIQNTLIANGMRWRTTWAPTGTEFPTYGVSDFGELVDLGPIKKGDCFFLSGDYNIGGIIFPVGTLFICNADNGTTNSSWLRVAPFNYVYNELNLKLDIPTGTSSQYIDGTGSLQTFPTLSNASNLILEVYNNTGSTLTKGTVVYINGGQGNLPTVTKALADSDSTSAQTLGIIQTDLTNMNNGYVLVIGKLTDINTNAYAPGTQLYLSGTTAGTYTSTKPKAPTHLVYVGIVSRQHPTQGIIEVKVQNGYEMDELHDVQIYSLQNNHALLYNSATSLWENKFITTAEVIHTTDKRYVTDAQLTVIGNTSGTNTGDNAVNSLYSGLASSKQDVITLTTTGTSGASTLIGNVLNIPQYSGGGGGSQTLEQTLANGNSAGAYNINMNNKNITNISDISANNGPLLKAINLTNATNMILMYNS